MPLGLCPFGIRRAVIPAKPDFSLGQLGITVGDRRPSVDDKWWNKGGTAYYD
jgi:hypothetical protein